MKPRRHLNRPPVPGGAHLGLRRSLAIPMIVALLLALLSVAPAAATSTTMAPACDGINIRTAASTSATVVVRLGPAVTVTVTGTVAGGSWAASCPTAKAGSTWYTVSAINGTAAATLYGASIVYAATGVLTSPAAPAGAAATAASAVAATATPAAPAAPSTPPAAPTAPSPAPPAAGATALAPACDGVNIRKSPSTAATAVVRLGVTAKLTGTGTVTGGAWSATCPTSKSGSTWFAITAVNGTAVASIYGATVVYAATGVMNVQPASPTAATQPPPATPTSAPPAAAAATPTPAPVAASPTPVATNPIAGASSAPTGQSLVPACDGVNIRATASTSAAVIAKVGLATTLVVSGTTTGSTWSTTCPTAKSGSGWYVVTHINGATVQALFGVPSLYAAVGVLTAPAPPAAPAATTVTLGSATTFYGRGYGHGVGLSQYGARGRALAGQTAAQILARYYAGTTIGTIPSGSTIRVLVLDTFAASATAPLTIAGRGGAWSVSGIGRTFPADAILRLAPATASPTGWQVTVRDASGAVLSDGPAPLGATVAGTSEATTLQLVSKPTNYDLFRGVLRWSLSGSTATVVNELPLETYLRGVVPSEMPSSWPADARLAQTIASRSFAAYRLRPGTGTFDLYDDTRSQVYRGVHAETAVSDATIAASANQVLRSGTALVNALFHSTAGGATENNENVFVSASGARTAGVVAYLRGSLDRDSAGVSYDAAAPYATWQTGTYGIAQLSSIFGADSRTAVGTLTAIDLSNRGVSGRLISVTLTGSGGFRTVSGQVFVDVFNANRPSGDLPLRSTLVGLAPIP
ncbi:MAG: SpoIID/LytB domain-containing protein [Chloroflexi bacterium]|nr:SpoIID/LytB domain-containing protein [Chloroflexota bacterium]